eukprot:scaffold17572_cov32-Tisochrysis_lutea.AAC.12
MPIEGNSANGGRCGCTQCTLSMHESKSACAQHQLQRTAQKSSCGSFDHLQLANRAPTFLALCCTQPSSARVHPQA